MAADPSEIPHPTASAAHPTPAAGRVRPLVLEPDPRLRTRSTEIAAIDEGVRGLAADMVETMRACRGIGLAAVQVGETLRMIVVEVPDRVGGSTALVMVNPEIMELGEEKEPYPEGCLSIPGRRVVVERPTTAVCRFFGLDGLARTARFGGMAATCLQHEIDHLEGILILDRGPVLGTDPDGGGD